MGGGRSAMPLMMVALVFTIGAIFFSTAQAQSSIPSCAQNLIPCADHLTSTNPPASCCDPIKKTVETQLTCLCNLFYSPGLLQSFNISTDQALQLSRRCGVTSDLSSCKSGSAPSPASVPPPATPGSDKGSSAGRVSFAGVSTLLLLWSSMPFN
uniref:Bifunctional inhibitor/plant lipid transfer protein/seed storage helical domain-containing protein n=1 Tax=Lotus japonicus TaxID=34305 RepID=I3S0V1_LOTJA|nr:unknown [Lotus japonicus]